MATLRTSQLAHLLIVCACSASDPTPSDVQGVYALDPSVAQCSGSNCPYENVLGAGVAGGSAFVAHDTGSSGGSGGGPTGWAVERLEFDGGRQTLATNATSTGAAPGQLEVTGGVVDFLQSNGLVEIDATQGGRLGAGSGSVSQGDVIGLVVDRGPPTVLFYGTSSQLQKNDCTGSTCVSSDPDSPEWNAPGTSSSGSMNQLDLSKPAPATTQTTMLVTYSRHLVAADATNVYWVAAPEPGTITSAPKADITQKSVVATVASGKAASGLAVSASGNTLAWSSTGDLFANPPATPSCAIWVRGASAPVFSTSQFFCLGLAVDDANAYFAVVSIQQGTANDNGQPQKFDYVAGTAIGRVALAGPATQQPVLVPTVSSTAFGPRRVILDPTSPDYVYAIDPQIVMRVKKSAFGP